MYSCCALRHRAHAQARYMGKRNDPFSDRRKPAFRRDIRRLERPCGFRVIPLCKKHAAPFHTVLQDNAHLYAFLRFPPQDNRKHGIADRRKNKQLMEKLAIVSQKTLRKKILAYLSVQAQESGSGDENDAFVIPLGRVELASYLNVDRSALTRELNNMKEDGIIDFSRNTFRLLE